jgi:hypothetical protein
MKPIKMILSILFYFLNLAADELPEECIGLICSGGLGQDLFAFSAAYSQAKRLDIPLVIDSDRDNGLLSIFKDKFISISKSQFSHFPIVKGIKNSDGKIVYNFKHSTYNKPNVTYYSNSTYGYYLSLQWFENEHEEIKNMIIPPKKTLEIIYNKYEKNLSAPIKIGIHLRTFKPDSVENYHLLWEQPTAKYFEKAFALLPDDALFFVASDNIPYAKEIFSAFNKNFIFLNDSGSDEIKKFTGNSTTLEEFFLLTMCDHFIGTKSSFSFWAAILNKNPKKIVILPKDLKWNLNSMIEESWNLIPF